MKKIMLIGVFLAVSTCMAGDFDGMFVQLLQGELARRGRCDDGYDRHDRRGNSFSIQIGGTWRSGKKKDDCGTGVETNDAWVQRGKQYGNVGRWEEALECFRRAMTIEPLSVDAHYCAGVVYGKLGQLENARRELMLLEQIVETAQMQATKLRRQVGD